MLYVQACLYVFSLLWLYDIIDNEYPVIKSLKIKLIWLPSSRLVLIGLMYGL